MLVYDVPTKTWTNLSFPSMLGPLAEFQSYFAAGMLVPGSADATHPLFVEGQSPKGTSTSTSTSTTKAHEKRAPEVPDNLMGGGGAIDGAHGSGIHTVCGCGQCRGRVAE